MGKISKQRLIIIYQSSYKAGGWVISLILLLATAVHAQQFPNINAVGGSPMPAKLTMDQAIDEAIEHNLGLLAERMNLTLAEASMITARLKPNPVVSVSADHLDLLGSGFNDRNGGGPAEFAWRVDIPIERGGKRDLRIATAKYAKDIAELQLLDAIRKLKMDVALACIDIIQAKSNLTLARDNLRTFSEVVRVNEAKLNDGAIAPLELTRSRVTFLQFQNNVKRAGQDLLTARIKLQNQLGRKILVDDFDIVTDLKAPLQSAEDLLMYQKIALTTRPDVIALNMMEERSKSDLKLQIAQGKVDFTYGVEYRRQQGINGKSNSLGLFFSAPLPLSNRNQGEIARVQAEQEQLSRQSQALKAHVEMEVRTAFQEFRASSDLVESIERDLINPAQQARDSVAYVYKSGAATLVDLLDAQRTFNETMQSYYEAEAAYRRAVVQLNMAIGREVIQ